MATLEQLHQALRNADAAGDVDAARTLANHIKGLSPPAQIDDALSPTGTVFENAAAGLGKAIVDTGRGIKGLFVDNSADVAESRRLDAPLMKTGAGLAGNIAGNVGMVLAPGGILKGAGALAVAANAGRAANALNTAGSAVMAPTTLKGAATLGAGMGAIQPAVSGSERLTNAGIGGAAGAGGQALFNGLAGVIRPKVSSEVQNLLKEGITPTPGQILGGGFKRAEEGLTSVPIVGDAIKGAQTRAVTDLNRAAFNRALSPVGEELPKGLVGREAVDHVQKTLGAKYEALMPKLTTQADGQFISEIQNLRNMVGNGSIDPAMAKRFESILNNQLMVKFKGDTPTLTGQTMKQIESDLGQLASKFHRSQDADQMLLGDAIQEVQDILRQTVIRSNPQSAEELKAINAGYANFKRVQRAASGLGAEEGLFSPAQLQNAVKALDRSKDKGAFARGDALMQDLSEPAKKALGNKLPDSGTPYRGFLTLGGAGAAQGLIGPAGAVGVLAAPAMYSKLGQNALVALLTKRPDIATPASNALRRIAPYAVAPAIGSTEY
jgi:hypothetical protein